MITTSPPRSLGLFAAAVACMLWVAPQSQAQISSKRLQDAVQYRIQADPYLRSSAINATVEKQQVTLRGHVANLVVKTRAERVAETVPGIVEVHNEIRIHEAEQTDDDELQEAVLKRFTRNPAFAGLDVDVTRGVANVTGRVPRLTMVDAAIDLASEVDGLTDVQDDIQVRADMETEEGPIGQSKPSDTAITDPKIREQNRDPGDTASDLLKQPARRGNAVTDRGASRNPLDPGSDNAGDGPKQTSAENPSYSDGTTSADRVGTEERVRRAIDADTRLNPNGLIVSVDDGIARVAGDVRTLAERRQLRNAIGNVTGIREVNLSQIDVTGKRTERSEERLSDDRIAEYVRMRLDSSAKVDAAGVDVSVDDRVVTLSGQVDRAGHKRRAVAEARMVRDVRGVKNELTVGSGRSGEGSSPTSRPNDDQTESDEAASSPAGRTAFFPDAERSKSDSSRSDSEIESDVRDRVAEIAPDIEVRVADGTVNLQGSVSGSGMATEAVRAAEDVRGVQSVLNNLDADGASLRLMASADPYVDGVGAFDFMDDEDGLYSELDSAGLVGGIGSPAVGAMTRQEMREALANTTPGGIRIAADGTAPKAENNAAIGGTTEAGAATDSNWPKSNGNYVDKQYGEPGEPESPNAETEPGGAPSDVRSDTRRGAEPVAGRSVARAPAGGESTGQSGGPAGGLVPAEVRDDLGPIDEVDTDDLQTSRRRDTDRPLQTGSDAPKDRELAEKVEAALKESVYLEPGDVQVSAVTAGRVLLSGAVNSYVAWAAAQRAAFEAGAADVEMRVRVY